jgi:hypothetical protein
VEGDRGNSFFVHISLSLFWSPFAVFDACLHRLRFPSCDSCMIAGVPCLGELLKDGLRRTSCDQCRQLKKVCHWDLVGVTGPRDPTALKRSCRSVKKPVINMDDNEEVAGGSLPFPVADIAAL